MLILLVFADVGGHNSGFYRAFQGLQPQGCQKARWGEANLPFQRQRRACGIHF